MSQWITTQAKQRWLKLLFSLIASLFSWWYIHETLVVTKVFNDVPIYIHGLPPSKTLAGLRKDNRLLGRQLTLNLKGRKSALDKIQPDQIEIRINAANREDMWKHDLQIKELRCLNSAINLERDIVAIEHSPLTIRLSNKTSRDIPISILSSGNLPKNYKLIDILPNKVTQTIDCAEEVAQSLATRRLFLNFDLSKLTLQQIEKANEEHPQGSEIYFKVPESWKYLELPPPIGETVLLKDPDIENLMLVLFKPVPLKIEKPIPIRISPLPLPELSSPIINHNLSLAAEKDKIELINHTLCWVKPVYIDGVSLEFLEATLPHLELVIYIGTEGQIQGQFELANIKKAQDKYVQNVLKKHFERSRNLEDSVPKHLRDLFWQYFTKMSFYGEAKTRLELDFDLNLIKDNQLLIKEKRID